MENRASKKRSTYRSIYSMGESKDQRSNELFNSYKVEQIEELK